jgi:hypothetical protein
MKYGYTSEATQFGESGILERVLRGLLFFLPEANPDSKRLFPLLARWAIEVDDDGRVNREIGLASNGHPLFVWPDSRNYGFWSDTDMTFGENNLEIMPKDDFEAIIQQYNEAKKGA